MGEESINDWVSMVCRAEGLAVFWAIRRQGKTVWIRQGELGSQGEISVKHYAYEQEAQALLGQALRKRRLLGFREAGPEDFLCGELAQNLMQGAGVGLIPAAAQIRWSLSERLDRIQPVFRPDTKAKPRRLPKFRQAEQNARALKRVLGEVLPAHGALSATGSLGAESEALACEAELVKALAGLARFSTSTGEHPKLSQLEAALSLRLDPGPWAASYLIAAQGFVNTCQAALLAWPSAPPEALPQTRSGSPHSVFPYRLAACLVLHQALERSETPKTYKSWIREQISAQGAQGRLLLAFISNEPDLIEREAEYWLAQAEQTGKLPSGAYLLWPLLGEASQLQRMTSYFLSRDPGHPEQALLATWLEDSVFWLLDRSGQGCAATLAQLVRQGQGPLRRRAAEALSLLRGPESLSDKVELIDSPVHRLMQASLAAEPAQAIAPLLRLWQAKPHADQVVAMLKQFAQAYPESFTETEPELRQHLNLPILAGPSSLPEPFGPAALASVTGSRLPGWWRFESVPAPVLSATGQALPPLARDLLADLLAQSKPSQPATGLSLASQVCSLESLARFAWRGFELWLAYGAARRERWLMTSLCHLGGETELRALGERLEQLPDRKALNQNAGLSHALAGLDVLEIRARAGSQAAAQALYRLGSSHHPPLQAAALEVITRL